MPTSVRAIAWVCLYLLASALVTYFFEGNGEVVLIWPPAAVAFALLLIEGWRWWPLIALSVTIMHLVWAPVPPLFLAFSALANSVAALAGCAAVKLMGDADIKVLRVRVGFVLAFGGIVLAVVSAIIGVAGLVLSEMIHSDAAVNAMAKWFMGDLLGTIALAPALLMTHRVCQRGRLSEEGLHYAGWKEKTLWVLAMASALLIMLALTQGSQAYALGLSSLPLGLLLWSALRFEPLLTSISTSALVLGSTVLAGLGFAGFVPPTSLLESTILLVFMSLLAVIPLVVTATTFETRVAAMALFRRATTDRLTDLPNRAAFENQASRWLGTQARRPAALVYLDLDQFKIINDTFSHAEGDQLVQQIAALLKAKLEPNDYLARIGGDEFALLLDHVTPEQAQQRCQQLVRAISDYRHAVGKRVQTVTASIGIVPISEEPTSYADLLSQADAACFTAKELGGNRVQLAGLGEKALEARTTAMAWAVRLKEALEQRQIELYCQSIVPVRQGESEPTSGARNKHLEVLLRLQSSDGQLSPSQVVHAAERFQLATRLDRYIIDTCLNWFDQHPSAADQVAVVSINLSAHSLSSEQTIEFLQQRLASSTLPATSICFEITETSAIRDLDRAQQFISQLRQLGCKFALDDFGTGFCSFAYLSTLDVDYYKIDGSFVRQVENSPLALSIVRSMAEIGRSLGKQTVAECVESEAIRKRIALLGVDHAQGFAIDRPQPIADYFDRPTPELGVA